MASDGISRRDAAATAISESRALIAIAPALPWQLDVREPPALDHDNVLLRDAAGGAIASVHSVQIAELVARSVNERAALLGLEEAVRAYREALAAAAQARIEHRESPRHQTAVNILDEAIGAAVRKLDRVRSQR